MSHQDLADAVRAVLAAAQTLVHGVRAGDDPVPLDDDLSNAMDALDAALANAGPVVLPDTPWREVLAGDEVYAPKTDRWYRVDQVEHAGHLTKVVIDVGQPGFSRAYAKSDGETVTVRRPASPESDALAVLWAAGFDLTTLASGG
jgi:hypothetical protein